MTLSHETVVSGRGHIYQYIASALFGVVVTLFIGMVTFGRTVITREEMESYVRYYTPYSQEKARIDQELRQLEEREEQIDEHLRVIDQRQQRMLQKLGMDGGYR